MNTLVFMITCLLFLLVFVGLPIVVVAWLVINFVENRRNKRYLDFIKHLNEVNHEHIHYSR